MTIATLLIALIATPYGDATGERDREPLLLDFHASWCTPCKQMRPAIEQLIQKGYQVKSVDIDRAPELAARYKVTEVPTFIIVDAAGKPLARTGGAQPAVQLARMYLAVKAKHASSAPAANPPDDDDRRAPPPAAENENQTEDENDRDRDRDRDSDRAASDRVNPKPWETVVRIKVHGQGSIGFGSGTIIASTPEESIILTCAHIFKLDGQQQAPPARFPRAITVDLFDGVLRGQQVHYANETYPGKAIDYDFTRDVGLIRIRPGRKLPAARVVPAHWKPQERMLMTTVGCSEGRDATAWNTTIIRPAMQGSLTGNPAYEAIECVTAPKQGRSGGGLFTSDGYIAGVCDFAEPRGNRGLYATPTSIYHILDHNKLSLCYAPVRTQSQPQTLLAGNEKANDDGDRARASSRPRTAPAGTRVRTQSPDHDEADVVMIPPPDLLGIKSPAEEVADGSPSRATRHGHGWHATPSAPDRLASLGSGSGRRSRAETTDLSLDKELDSDRFGPMPAPGPAHAQSDPATAAPPSRTKGSGWRPVRTETPELAITR
jgi:thiol-disulfide isomerase/thioredoxin